MNLDKYLCATYFFDHQSKEIQELIDEFKARNLSPKEQAIKLYLKVRDKWYYNPYGISFNKKDLVASNLYYKKEGHCIDKSVLLIAGLRALGIPARLHLAKVKNHIAVERLTEKFGTNELTPHGMVDLYLNGKWLKVSPAFNHSLCEKTKVDPLDFDGEHDSLFQEFNKENQLFMEYLDDYGHFEDLPIEFIVKNMKDHYPVLFQNE